MLFNSYIFIFLFLPISLLGFYFLGAKLGEKYAITWLVLASLFFYGCWNPPYLLLLILSIVFNYSVGLCLEQYSGMHRKPILVFGITFNLAILGYFKYSNFFMENINWLTGNQFNIETILLPLAISFFTFQQIAYLSDAYKRKTQGYSFLHYCLFVVFFPQLIAGPIVHHNEMLSQFMNKKKNVVNYENLSIGSIVFFLGLFKKVVLADNLAVYASPVFDAAEVGTDLTIYESWLGILAYTFQLYFDFSGYSDMAIGLGRMFGVKLPLNFFSPYKANNIVEFWRRWHITLSRFLRDYIYIPLGGNRSGKFKRYRNLMFTMLLGGLWHGAAWNFVIWGALHGSYLMINHAWQKIPDIFIFQAKTWYRALALCLTFFAVLLGWVFFRAETLSGAMTITISLFSWGDISSLKFVNGVTPSAEHPDAFSGLLLILTSCVICWGLPNTVQYAGGAKAALIPDYYGQIPNKSSYISYWKPAFRHLAFVSLAAALSLLSLNRVSEFLYFQF